MNVLMVGDVVGPEDTAWLADRLPALRHEHAIDLVIVNAENRAVTAPTPWAGFGMTQVLVERLLKAGADVITSGNHGWDGPEGGTGFVADVGMTGPTGHPGGFPLAHFAASYRGDDWSALPPLTLATGPMTLGAVLLRIEDGKTQSITRIR